MITYTITVTKHEGPTLIGTLTKTVFEGKCHELMKDPCSEHTFENASFFKVVDEITSCENALHLAAQ